MNIPSTWVAPSELCSRPGHDGAEYEVVAPAALGQYARHRRHGTSPPGVTPSRRALSRTAAAELVSQDEVDFIDRATVAVHVEHANGGGRFADVAKVPLEISFMLAGRTAPASAR